MPLAKAVGRIPDGLQLLGQGCYCQRHPVECDAMRACACVCVCDVMIYRYDMEHDVKGGRRKTLTRCFILWRREQITLYPVDISILSWLTIPYCAVQYEVPPCALYFISVPCCVLPPFAAVERRVHTPYGLAGDVVETCDPIRCLTAHNAAYAPVWFGWRDG